MICEGRVVIVTGAGRGLGRTHALALAKEGAKVVVNDLGTGLDGTGASASPGEEVVEEIRALGGHALADGTDITDFETTGALVAKTIAHFGRLDVIVNNAGFLRDRMFVTMSVDEWDAVT